MHLKSPRTATALLLFVTFVWGAMFTMVDEAIQVVPTHTFNTLRFLLAGICLLPLIGFDNKLDKQAYQSSKGSITRTGLLLGLILFIGFATQTEGLHYTSVSNAGFITGLNVPFVPLLAFMVFRSRISTAAWIGVISATIGLWLLTVGDKLDFNLGDTLMLMCALAFAAHIVMTGHFAKNLPAIRLSMIQMFAVSAYSALVAIALELDHPFYNSIIESVLNPRVISAILCAAVLGSALAYWAQTASQKILRPHQVALIFAAEPMFAHGIAAVFLGERLGIAGWAGAGLIISGMLISELGDRNAVSRDN